MSVAPHSTEAPRTVDDVRARAEQDEIEFFFAQFVDMHGKPSAKLVPAQNLDMLFEDGAGFAGFAAGPIGQTPASPGHRRDARPGLVHAGPVQAGPGPPGVRRHGRGRAVAVLPADDPQERARARAEARATGSRSGMELEFFLLRKSDDGTDRRSPTRSTRSTSPATT